MKLKSQLLRYLGRMVANSKTWGCHVPKQDGGTRQVAGGWSSQGRWWGSYSALQSRGNFGVYFESNWKSIRGTNWIRKTDKKDKPTTGEIQGWPESWQQFGIILLTHQIMVHEISGLHHISGHEQLETSHGHELRCAGVGGYVKFGISVRHPRGRI